MSDKDLLIPLSRFDEVEAATVSDVDQLNGTVSDSDELVLDLIREGRTQRIALTRHDAEVIIEVLHSVLHPNAHRSSPVQRLWGELDDVMDFLVDVDDPEPEDRARAKALATAIALISQPWSEEPNIDAIRDEAMDRWESRQ